MPEQFRFHEVLGNGAAVDVDERLIVAQAQCMDAACDELLARAGRPDDEQGVIGGRDAIDHADQLAKRRGFAYERAMVRFISRKWNDRGRTHGRLGSG